MLILAETDISVSCVGKGQFIRWYLNGWHYLFLEQGSESQVVEGTEALPSSYSRLALQAYRLKEGDLRAAKTVAFAPSLDLLTVDGWKNAILESGSVETKRTGASLYPISLTVNVFGKVADYSPVAEVVPPPLTDLDILRQIRDANPSSQLPSWWSEDKDPYTEWWDNNTGTGAVFGAHPHIQAIAIDYNIVLPDTIDPNRVYLLNCNSNQLTTLNVTGLTALQYLYCHSNLLTSMPSLTAKGLITDYDFTNNNFPAAELDRFRAMGFTNESGLLPQNP